MDFNKFFKIIKNIKPEAYIWFAGLLLLFLHNPYSGEHLTVCPLNLMGFEYCPGCGLGRSVSYLFYFDLKNSFAAHPLGIFALILLSSRIYKLVAESIKTGGNYGKSY